MAQKVRALIQSSIHYIVSRSGERIPWPLGKAIHGDKANEVAHAEFRYMGLAEGSDTKYLLLIKEDLSS